MQRACQALVDALVTGYRVPPIRVRVLARRPADDYGELHGLYEPGRGPHPARITVWMRTAREEAGRRVQDVPAHASCTKSAIISTTSYFKLEETFHTEGFYKRESSLAAALLAHARVTNGAGVAHECGNGYRLRLRERCRVPAAAERLDQPDAGRQAAGEDAERRALAVERRRCSTTTAR